MSFSLSGMTGAPYRSTSTSQLATVNNGSSSARTRTTKLHGHQSFFGKKELKKTQPEKKKLAEEPSGENEYISLLQQQIFFLELKLNMLQNGQKNEPPQNPGVPLEDVPDGPLEDAILSLRAKYVRMESQYKKDLQEAHDHAHELDAVIAKQQREVEQALQLVSERDHEVVSLRHALQAQHTDHVEVKLSLEEQVSRLTARLAAREQSYATLQAQLQQSQATAWADKEAAMQAKNDLERKLKEAEKKAEECYQRSRELEIERLELQEELKKENRDVDALNDIISTMKNERLRQEAKLIRTQVSLEEAEAAVKKAHELGEKLLADNQQLKLDKQSVESRLDMMNKKAAMNERAANSWSATLVDLRAKVAELSQQLQSSQQQLSERQQQLEQHRQSAATHQAAREHTLAQLEDEKMESKRQRDEQLRLSQQYAEAKKEALVKQRQLEELTATLAKEQASNAALREAKEDLTDQVKLLTNKLELSLGLKDLKLEEFETMARTNLKVAESINSLVSKIKPGEQKER